MKIEQKLQIKEGQTLAILYAPHSLNIDAPIAAQDTADGVLVFAVTKAELEERVSELVAAAKRDALVWLAYPKAKQLNTDLNRDIIHELMPSYELDAVRQIAIGDTWSAMRFKYIG